jgi:SAM-dependent methyltransferase
MAGADGQLQDQIVPLHRAARRLLREIEPRRSEFTDAEMYFDLRSTEFLLLATRLARVPGITAERVLEIGCGSGFTTRLWSELSPEVVGIDLPEEVVRAKRFLQAFPPPGDVEVLAAVGEDLSVVEGDFDLVFTEYVLEHVNEIDTVLAQAKLRPGGHIVHVLNSLVDRHEWFVSYRLGTPVHRRLQAAVEATGVLGAARGAGSFTPPHEPRFGDFAHEHGEYRLERWASHMLAAGHRVVDWFQTRDINWVLVTVPLDGDDAG